MRVTVLKVGKHGLAALLGYYVGLAEDQQRRDGVQRGPVDYYVDPNEPPGRWWGRGVAALELGCEVKSEQLAALLDGRHPGHGRPLGRGFGDKSARGFDATFSAPKSVSLLWALSPDAWVRAEVLAAHDTAVVNALEWLEQHGAVTRRGKDGVDQVDSQGLVAALFRQHTSRTADPQLHTHAIVANKVQDRTGKWLSLDARFLVYQQCAVGWVYAAVLRTELTTRLGVQWGDIVNGHADVEGVPQELMELFSHRTEQVEAKLTQLIGRWVHEHDGADPSPRTIARLERKAVLASRPAKQHLGDHEALRAEWLDHAREAGFEPLTLADRQPPLPGTARCDEEALIAQALAAVTEAGSTWLRADLAREFAARVPVGAASCGAELVTLVDQVATTAAARCVELHPPGQAGLPTRADGRPISEHVTDRRLTTQAILDQEVRLIRWAHTATGDRAREVTREDGAPVAALKAISGHDRLVLVVGPAGAGKTTVLGAAAETLRRRRRPIIGLAPSGKAADVLARETGAPAATLAKLLHEHTRPEGPAPEWRLAPGTSVVVDEAGMAGTDDLAALVTLVDHYRWRLICVGDPEQLPAVGRGGMFSLWCDTLPAYHLERILRFSESWEAEASLGLRRGDPKTAAVYGAHGRLGIVHPALLAGHVARQHASASRRGESVTITTASAATAMAINREIQRRRNPKLERPSVSLVDGTKVFAGDQIATRRNDASLTTTKGVAVRNRHTWTVTAIGTDGSVTVEDPERGRVRLPAIYAGRHVELGWAVTGYGSQGVTVDRGICVVEASSSRAGIYVGMTRGRKTNMAWMLDRTGLIDVEEAFATAIARPANALTAHGTRAKLYRAAGVTPPEIERGLNTSPMNLEEIATWRSFGHDGAVTAAPERLSPAERMRLRLDALERRPSSPGLGLER